MVTTNPKYICIDCGEYTQGTRCRRCQDKFRRENAVKSRGKKFKCVTCGGPTYGKECQPCRSAALKKRQDAVMARRCKGCGIVCHGERCHKCHREHLKRTVKTKVCELCEETKPIEEFFHRHERSNPLTTWCKECKKFGYRRFAVVVDGKKRCTSCKKWIVVENFAKLTFGRKVRFNPDGSLMLRGDCSDCHRSAVKHEPGAVRRKNQRLILTPKQKRRKKYRSKRNQCRTQDIEFSLDEKQFNLILDQTHCYYCGIHVKDIPDISSRRASFGMTLDRIDPKQGYTISNVVPACWECNRMKSDKFTIDEFMRIGKIISDIREERKVISSGIIA